MCFEKPDWQPLLELAPDYIDDFMWMFEVELENGTVIHAYKHIDTRQYLHLDAGGGAYVYCEADRYREIDPDWLLRIVLRRRTM